jgi:uncharacterized protein
MDTTTLARERYVSITTFRRDGTAVSTPVWIAGEDGVLLVHSDADCWKVKRIRRDGHVRLAPCNARGVVHGDAVDADATLDEDTSEVSALLARKYGLMFRAVGLFTRTLRTLRRQSQPASVTIRIVPRLNDPAKPLSIARQPQDGADSRMHAGVKGGTR